MYQVLEHHTIEEILKPLGLHIVMVKDGDQHFYTEENGNIARVQFSEYSDISKNREDFREVKTALLKRMEEARGNATAIFINSMHVTDHPLDGVRLTIDCAMVRRKEDVNSGTDFDAHAISGEHVAFGVALEALKNGFRVRRESWDAGTFLYMVPGSHFVVNRAPLLGIYPESTEITYAPHIDIKSGDNYCQVWQVSQDAIIAEDWTICMRGA